MKNKKNIFILRAINTFLFVILIFMQYNAVFSIKIAQANPMLPLALFIAVCMFCSELSGVISGLVIGVFIDATAATPPGFNTIMFILLGLGAVLIIKHLFNNNIFSALCLCLICSDIYYLARWFFCYVGISSLTDSLTYIMQIAFPSALYTTAFVVPFYYLEKMLYKKFYK